MGWTHHDGISTSNAVSSNATFGTEKVTTLYANAYNYDLKILVAKTGSGNYSIANISTADSIKSAQYFRFSDAVLKTGGTVTATTKIKAAHTVSISGITSNSIVLVNWIDKYQS